MRVLGGRVGELASSELWKNAWRFSLAIEDFCFVEVFGSLRVAPYVNLCVDAHRLSWSFT